MRSSILYDIRRSLIRPATLILVIGLALAGAGLAYVVLAGFSTLTTVSQYYLIYTVHIGGSGAANTTYFGLLLSVQGQPVGGAKVLLGGKWYVTNSSGYVKFNVTSFSSPLTVNVNGVNYTAEMTSVAVLDVDLTSRSGELVVAAPPLVGNNSSTSTTVYNVYYYQGPEIVAARANYTPTTYLGQLKPGEIGSWRIRLALNKPIVYVYMNETNASSSDPPLTSVTATATAVPGVIYTVLVPQLEVIQARALAESTSFGILAEFLPLMALVIVNDLFARPRASGAMDYVLSRPITKGQLYTSRLAGGLVAMVVGAAVSALLTGVVTALTLGVSINATTLAYASLALVVDLLCFYSLLYLVSALTPRRYMAVSIVLYLLLYLVDIFGLLALLGYSWLSYLSPRSLFQRVLGLGGLTSSVGIVSFSPSAVSLSGLIIASVLWIVLPALLGFIIYRRQDLP